MSRNDRCFASRIFSTHLLSLWFLMCIGICPVFAGEPVDVPNPATNIKSKKQAWTSSNLQGSPDPPAPYVLELAYPFEFMGPISLNRVPDDCVPNNSIILVAQHDGQIYVVDTAKSDIPPTLLIDFNATPTPLVRSRATGSKTARCQLFSLTYHPNFAQNRYVYVCLVTHVDNLAFQTHIIRYELSLDEQPKLDIDSELEILNCDGGGHNGCTLAFGNDGYLYISIGDLESPNPPDPRETGQDISDLYSSILRIDVDGSDANLNYRIPADNPFVNTAGARPEVFAYGFRNPFRFSFDRPTGDLWVGDVGWEAWEMVYRVRPGGNYGWAIKEGPGDVKRSQPQGPTPILPPDIVISHAEAASMTGGMVYRGKALPELYGQYVFGDWTTRKFWAANFDSKQVIDFREIAGGNVKPICFETDVDGELLVMDYTSGNQASGIYRFVQNPALKVSQPDFPRLLSLTGLFSDHDTHEPAPGTFRYEVNASMWKDGAVAEYLLAVPGNEPASFYQSNQNTFDWFNTKVLFPKGSVLVKTYSFPPDAPQRIETQLAINDGPGDWRFYTYRWDDNGTDAALVDAAGDRRQIVGQYANGNEYQIDWEFGSRTSCKICHTPWSGEALAFVEPQLRQPLEPTDSWRQLLDLGAVVAVDPALPDDEYLGLVDVHDARLPLDRRVRSYLHTNCSHCHQNGGNASTGFDISFEKRLDETRMIEVKPMRGELGLSGANIVTPGEPAQSLLYYRLAKSGSGRMPHIGNHFNDPTGIHLIQSWIAQLPRDPKILTSIDNLCSLRTSPNNDQGMRREAYHLLLSSIPGAIELAGAIAEGRVPGELVREIVDASKNAEPAIQELIEPFAAVDQRIARLGNETDPTKILSLAGNPEIGRQLFVSGIGTCAGCHKLDGVGQAIGPDLRESIKRLGKAEQILRSITHPSEAIEEAYQAYQLVTIDGLSFTGRILNRDEDYLTLQTSTGEEKRILVDDIEVERKSPLSLMPEQLLAPLTAQQAADLLAYLQSL